MGLGCLPAAPSSVWTLALHSHQEARCWLSGLCLPPFLPPLGFEGGLASPRGESTQPRSCNSHPQEHPENMVVPHSASRYEF